MGKLIAVPRSPYLFKDLDSGVYYYRRFKKGYGRIKKSTGERVLARAKNKIPEIEETYFAIKDHNPKLRQPIVKEWGEWLKIQSNKAPATYEQHEIMGRCHILPFFADKFPQEVNESLWEEFITRSLISDPDKKLTTVRKCFTMFLHFLKRKGAIREVPKLRNPDPARAAGKVYTKSEIDRLLSHANPDLYLQIIMALTMGMRKSEILMLSWERVDLDEKIIKLRAQDTKIRKARSFGISKESHILLRQRRQDIDSAYVFPSPNDSSRPVGRTGNKTAWTNCRRDAKVKGRFHDLRHTFLTHAFKHATNPALICEYAGLSLSEAQKTYLHFTVEDTRIVSTLFNPLGGE